MNQTVLTIRTNTITLSNYEETGDAFARGVPRISYGASFRVMWYLYTNTPGYGSPGVDVETWTPDTSYDNCLALFTCDNDYRKKVTGTITAPLEYEQSVTEITANFSGDTAKLYIPEEGILTLYDEIGEEEYIAYSGYNATEANITFFVPDGYTMASSYVAGDELSAPQEPLFSANMVASESDPGHGLFVFDITASSRKFRDLIEGKSKVPNLGFELLPYQLVNAETGQTENRPSFLLSNVTLTQPIGDSGYPASVPPSSQNMILSNIASIIAAGDEIQFTDNPADESSAHTTQTDSDTHYRFRNAVAQGDWSPWIKLLRGVKGDTGAAGKDGVSVDNVEQTTTSTESGGTNVITVTLSDGQTFTFSVKNGAAGENGQTPYIGTNKHWWVGTEDTGILAEGSNLFANGVPPYEFTTADLTDGILSRTFADLGIDSALPVSVNLIDNNGVIMDGDDRLTMIWTETGLKVDLSQFETVDGTWKLVFAGGTKVEGGGGGGSGNGYTRTFVTQDSNAQSGYWHVASVSDITLTLPAGGIGYYARFSTTASASNVTIVPASGETIDGDSEGLTIDKTSGTTELFWDGSGWVVIEAK